MNAAARLVHQGALSRHLVLTHVLTRRQCVVLFLVLTLIVSAFGIIYVTHTTRVLYANYQRQLGEQNRLTVERSQLLLERSAWMMQARVEQLAKAKLGMVVPNHDKVVVIH